MSLPRWFAHSLWQPSGRADRYHHQCQGCSAVLKQAKREGLREVGLSLFGLVGAISMFFHMYPLLPDHYGWVVTEFVGWIMVGGALSTLVHYPFAKYVPASPDTHGFVPVSKVVSPAKPS